MDQNKLSNIKLNLSDFEKDEPVFSETEYKEFKDKGLTEEEIKTLEDAELLSRAAEILPDNPEELSKKVAELCSKQTTEEGVKYIVNLAKTDPQAFIQMIALSETMDHVEEVK